MLYIKRSAVVDATRWFENGDHALVVEHGAGWAIATPEGWLDVASGDWIITDSTGCSWPMSNVQFEATYELVT
jgi:hypothetical protein